MIRNSTIASFRWRPDSLMAQTSQWIFELNDDLIRHLSLVNTSLNRSNKDLQDFRQLDAFKKFCVRVKSVVVTEVGIALVKCGSYLNDDQSRFFQVVLGQEFGDIITITAAAEDRPLFSLEVKADPTFNGRYQGGGLRSDSIGYHTDGSGNPDRDVRLVSMQCIRSARFGGQCRLTNSLIAYESLPEAARCLLHKPYPRTDPNDPHRSLDSLLSRPIFTEEGHDFSYHPSFLRLGIEKTKGAISHEEEHAFRMLERALEDAGLDVNLTPHEILLINNKVVAHDRREFCDENSSPRLIERLWAGTYRS